MQFVKIFFLLTAGGHGRLQVETIHNHQAEWTCEIRHNIASYRKAWDRFITFGNVNECRNNIPESINFDSIFSGVRSERLFSCCFRSDGSIQEFIMQNGQPIPCSFQSSFFGPSDAALWNDPTVCPRLFEMSTRLQEY